MPIPTICNLTEKMTRTPRKLPRNQCLREIAPVYLAITGTAAFLAIVARTSIEESILIDRFGHDYVDYMRQTGRFLPRIHR